MMVTCATCGKEYNRAPAYVQKNERNFCSRHCAETYTGKPFSGQYGGKPTKRDVVQAVAGSLEIGQPYKIGDIAIKCQQSPGRYKFTDTELAQILYHFCDDMVSLGGKVWMRQEVPA